MKLPPTLVEFLEAGGDLASVPTFARVAEAVVASREVMSDEERGALAGYFLEQATAFANGHPHQGIDGVLRLPTDDGLRHAMWMAQGLGNDHAADLLTQWLGRVP